MSLSLEDKPSVFNSSLMKHWPNRFLFLFTLCPFSAWACVDNDSLFNTKSVYFLLGVELAIVGLVFLGWLIARKLWPNGMGRWGFYLAGLTATLLYIGLVLFKTLALPAYLEVFARLGVEMPAVTEFTLYHGAWLWLATIATVFLWWAAIKSRRALYLVIMCVLDLEIFVWVLWVLNLVIFKLCN